MSPAPLATRRPRFIYLLAVAHRRLQAAIARDGDGSSATRAGLLLALSPHGPTPMAALGPLLDLAPPALSNLVERAVRAKLVAREPDASDGRAWKLLLTTSGRAARKLAVEHAQRLNARLSEGFSDRELEVVARWLTTVRDRFPPHEETP